jgi:hypothetical protein
MEWKSLEVHGSTGVLNDKLPTPFREQGAYYVEPYLESIINMGQKRNDVNLLSEAAEIYLAFEPWFSTLGELGDYGTANGLSTSTLKGRGPNDSRTLAYTGNNKMEEYTLTMVQFLYPACRLMRIISERPSASRSSTMNEFVAVYTPLLVTEHLVRNLDVIKYPIDVNGVRVRRSLIGRWEETIKGTLPSEQSRMNDRYLWYIASAAEILGAKKNGLIPLDSTIDESVLKASVLIGAKMFESKRTISFSGGVRCDSYFNGENYISADNFSTYPDYAYSGYSVETYPTLKNRSNAPQASWDISHFYRVPLFMRALYENKSATGCDFPSDVDINSLVNQFRLKVFQGDMARPLFNNYFDGTNGWYRVGYAGRENFGYPPAEYADRRSSGSDKLSLINSFNLGGYASLSAYDQRMNDLLSKLVDLAASTDSQVVEFRNRYYGDDFVFKKGRQPNASTMLLTLLGGMEERSLPTTYTTVMIPPTVSPITMPTLLTTAQTVSIQVNANDNEGVETVLFLLDGVVVATRPVSSDSTYSMRWPVSAFYNGPHIWKATAFDGSGNNASSAGVPVTVAIPLPAPDPWAVSSCEELRSKYKVAGSPELPCEFDFTKFRARDERIAHLAMYGYGDTVLLNAGGSWEVGSAAEMNALPMLVPGDQVILKDGDWIDQAIEMPYIRGTWAHPIVIRPQTPGGVRLKGTSRLKVSGENVIIDDLQFVDGGPSDPGTPMTVLQLGLDDRPCNDCVVNHVTIENYNSATGTELTPITYLSIAGSRVTVANSKFVNKRNAGPMVVAGAHGHQGLHLLNNEFQGRPAVTGLVGPELLQVGDSTVPTERSYALIAGNVFEGSVGGTETVSIRVSDVIIQGNRFNNNQGPLSLRSGNRVLVLVNDFDGGSGMGGIRVAGAGHWVAGNRVANLTNPANGFNWPVSLAMGNVDALTDVQGDAVGRVKNVVIAGNRFEDVEKGIAVGVAEPVGNYPLAPQNIHILGNQFIFQFPAHTVNQVKSYKPVTKFNGDLAQMRKYANLLSLIDVARGQSIFNIVEAPPIPTMTATSLESGIRLGWTAVTDGETWGSGVSQYIVQVSTKSDFNPCLVGWENQEFADTVLSTTIANLSYNTTYYAHVQSRDVAGNTSDYSAYTSTKVLTDVSNPTFSGLPVLAGLDGEIKVNWPPAIDTGGSGLRYYHIYVSSVPKTTFIYTKTGISKNLSTIVLSTTAFRPETTYYVRMRAQDYAGNYSLYTTTVSTTTTRDITPPNAPAGITVTAKSRGIDLSWPRVDDPGGSRLARYLVDVSTNSNFSKYVWEKKDMGVTLSTSVVLLIANKTYYARVWSQDGAGNISSTEVRGSTKTRSVALGALGLGEDDLPMAPDTVDGARAYPVPFRPGYGANGITFDRIPAETAVRIYTIDGRPVITLTTNTQGSVLWERRCRF